MIRKFADLVSKVFVPKGAEGSDSQIAIPLLRGLKPKIKVLRRRAVAHEMMVARDVSSRSHLLECAERMGDLVRAEVPCQDTFFLFLIGTGSHYVGYHRQGDDVFEVVLTKDDALLSRVIASPAGHLLPFRTGPDREMGDHGLLTRRLRIPIYSSLGIPLFDEKGGRTSGSPPVIVFLLNRQIESLTPRSTEGSARGPDRTLDLEGFRLGDASKLSTHVGLFLSVGSMVARLQQAIDLSEKAGDVLHSISHVAQAKLDVNGSVNAILRAALTVTRADRGTLWLVDPETCELYTDLIDLDGRVRERRLPIGDGFAGRCARDQKPVKIDYDLYSHPDSHAAKEADRASGYRTCSLLCYPVLTVEGKLLAVIQLVNKRRSTGGNSSELPLWPEPPSDFQASFTREDLEFLKIFSMLAGSAIENALLFRTLKEEERRKDDLLSTLTEGVASTDAGLKVITSNPVFARLVGVPSIRPGDDILALLNLPDGSDLRTLKSFLEAGSTGPAHVRLEGLEMRKADGTEFVANMKVSRFAEPEGVDEPLGFVFALEDLSREQRLKSAMARYMAKELVERLSERGEIDLGGVSARVTVLFSDIRSYTSLVENMTPTEVVTLLNEYFAIVVEPVLANSGTLDKYIGDAVMAVFGAPVALPDHGALACKAAVQMQLALRPFNAQRRTAGLLPLETGIGLNTDTVVSGNIGTRSRMDYTSIGDGVNLGSRLEGLTKFYGASIIVSDSTRAEAGDDVQTRWLDVITVKGKQEPVVIYELFGTQSDGALKVFPDGYLDRWERFSQCYMGGKFAEAKRLLETLERDMPNDQSVTLFKGRLDYLDALGPAERAKWDGVWRHSEK